MSELGQFFANPLLWKVIVGYWVFSAAIGAMPTPKTTSNELYQWAFRFSHLLAGNVNRAAVKFNVPGVDNPTP